MIEEKRKKDNSFLLGLSITLGTIVIGLVSYIVFSTDFSTNTDTPRCEYKGWAYADGETFIMEDGCNTCICSYGKLACTNISCTENGTVEDLN
jgi:hypothetical protein